MRRTDFTYFNFNFMCDDANYRLMLVDICSCYIKINTMLQRLFPVLGEERCRDRGH